MLIQLDFSSDTPIYMQIRNQIVLGLADGRLAPGEKLPTVRALADEAGVNMMTVSKAYQLLKQEGFIEGDRRSGAVALGKTGEHAVSEKMKAELKLIISEAKLGGIPKQAFIELAEQLYDEREV
jgi:DNA-binding transcriptional regulator YhcF (GntR family)